HNAVDQLLPYVVALASPDQQASLRVLEQKAAPLMAAQVKGRIALGYRGRIELWRRRTAHQYLARRAPHLEGQLALVGMPRFALARVFQRGIEGGVQTVALAVLHRHAHHALEHARG